MNGSSLLVAIPIFLVVSFGCWFGIRLMLFMMMDMMIQAIDDFFGRGSEKITVKRGEGWRTTPDRNRGLRVRYPQTRLVLGQLQSTVVSPPVVKYIVALRSGFMVRKIYVPV